MAGKVDVSEVNRGRPRGITADRSPYRGGLSATTKNSGLAQGFNSLLMCELIMFKA